jgi:hypothetical protein
MMIKKILALPEDVDTLVGVYIGSLLVGKYIFSTSVGLHYKNHDKDQNCDVEIIMRKSFYIADSPPNMKFSSENELRNYFIGKVPKEVAPYLVFNEIK